MENTAHTWMRYEMDNMELYRVVTGIEDAGLDVGIIYHSHTRTRPVSVADRHQPRLLSRLAVRDRRDGHASEPVVRAFTIRDGQVEETHLSVV